MKPVKIARPTPDPESSSWSESVLRLFNRMPFMQKVSTQTWLFITNFVFLLIMAGFVAAYVQWAAWPNIKREIRDVYSQEAVRTGNIVEKAETDERVQIAIETVASSSDAIVTWVGEDSVRVFPRFTKLPGTLRQDIAELGTDSLGYLARTGPNNEDVLISIVRLSNNGEYLHIQRQQSPLLLLAGRDITNVFVLALILGLIGTTFVSWLVALRVTLPLRTITRTAQRINEGYVDEEIVAPSPAAEFQDLAASLNLMADRFRNDIKEWQRLMNIQNEFIGNVSHEVKNPIFSVGGYLEALASADLPSSMRQKYVDKGLINLQRLNNLFSDLIEIARLEYREDLLHSESFDLKQLVEEVVETLHPIAREKSLTLEIGNESIDVFADRGRIRQVMTNLLQNGIAYSNDPGSVVRCRFRQHGDKVRVEIIDAGRGISEDHLDRIFERFYRIDTARSRAMGGTGLGLSIVKQILQAHGEEIHVESTLGRGTRFWFDLPVSTEPKATT